MRESHFSAGRLVGAWMFHGSILQRVMFSKLWPCDTHSVPALLLVFSWHRTSWISSRWTVLCRCWVRTKTRRTRGWTTCYRPCRKSNRSRTPRCALSAFPSFSSARGLQPKSRTLPLWGATHIVTPRCVCVRGPPIPPLKHNFWFRLPLSELFSSTNEHFFFSALKSMVQLFPFLFWNKGAETEEGVGEGAHSPLAGGIQADQVEDGSTLCTALRRHLGQWGRPAAVGPQQHAASRRHRKTRRICRVRRRRTNKQKAVLCRNLYSRPLSQWIPDLIRGMSMCRGHGDD